jgi:hypothetical protein
MVRVQVLYSEAHTVDSSTITMQLQVAALSVGAGGASVAGQLAVDGPQDTNGLSSPQALTPNGLRNCGVGATSCVGPRKVS